MSKIFTTSTLAHFALALCGIVMILFHSNAEFLPMAIRSFGVGFMLLSVAMLATVIYKVTSKSENALLLSTVPSIGGLCFGILLTIHPDMFLPTLSFVLAMVVTVLGFFQLIQLIMMFKQTRSRLWLYIVPIVNAVMGCSMLYYKPIQHDVATTMLMTGISILLYCLIAIILAFTVYRRIEIKTTNIE